jgi:hypothetical protein
MKAMKEACLEKLETNNQKLSRNLANATEDWEVLVCALVNSKVCKLAIVLQLLVLMIWKGSIIPINFPDSVYNYYHMTL